MSRKLSLGCLSLLLAMWVPTALLAAEVPAAKPAPVVKVGTTLQNLQAAYARELNAQASYTAYAAKAQAEGYLKVATLFKAVAMSEGLRAGKLADVLKGMGRVVKAMPEAAMVGTTRENLAAALREDAQDVDAVLPAYLKVAEADKNTKAKFALFGSKAIEAIHDQLFADALANLNTWKAAGNFYVCKVCGNTVAKLDFEFCSFCKAPVSEFQKF